MTEEQPKKKSEISDSERRVEQNKITDTAAQSDQTEKFRSMRRELAKGERAFSVASLIGPTSGAKFELTEGGKRIAAATKSVVTDESLKDAEAIRKATGNDNIIARWADRDAINKILEGKSETERTSIDKAYTQKYGHGLEKEMRSFETGSDLEKFLNVLHRSDSNSENQAARSIHEDLLENKNLVQGRSSSQIEKDMRDLLSTRNSAQIAKVEEEYKRSYGTSLQDALTGDSKISAATKESVPILLKGVENRSDLDTAKLIASSLKYRDSELFAETMRDASPWARKEFLQSGGEEKIKSAFSHWYSDKNVEHAMDYARSGKLAAATQVSDNTGILFDNKKGIDLAIDRMTDQERKMYSEGKVLAAGKTVENLPKEEEQKSRDYYLTLHKSLSAAGNASELAAYENKINPSSQSNGAEKPSMLTEINENKHWYGSNSIKILDSISGMSASEQEKYKTDASFRTALDKQIAEAIKEPRQLDAAQRMLRQVSNGKGPDTDPIASLEKIHNEDGSKSAQVVRDIEQSFRDDPSLKERILNPKTADDKKFAEQYKTAAQETLGDDFEIFGKPLVEKGQLPLEIKIGMNQGVFNNDYKTAFEDLQHATPEEKQKLKDQPAFREAVLGFMDKNRQQIALATLDQPQLRPEDKLRAGLSGWGGTAETLNELQQVAPSDLAQTRAEYTRKYGSSLDGDVMSKLSAHDREIAERIFTQNLTQDAKVNIARTQTEAARSGFGASVSDNIFRSGTGAQADDAQNQTARAEADQNLLAAGQEFAKNMSVGQFQELQSRVSAKVEQSIRIQNEATDTNIESKKKGAEVAGNVALVGGAIGSLIVTGGMDAPLVMGLAAMGASVKVGTNAALEGNNYDLSIKNVGFDAAAGSVTAATAVIGPGEVAAIFGIGKAAAIEAAKLSAAQVGQQLIVEGGKESLAKGTQEIVQQSLAEGARKISSADFTKLAERTISPEVTGVARETAVKELSTSLEKNVSDQIGYGVVTRFGTHGLNASNGALAGGASGTIEGAREWDSRRSVAENLKTIATNTTEGALTGIVTGGATSVGASGIARAWRSGQSALRDGANIVTRETNAGTEIAELTPRIDSQGKSIEVEWPKVPAEHIDAVRAQVKVDLSQVKASGGGSVLEKLEQSGMSAAQKTRVLDALGEVREHYAQNFATDADQPVNWIHTQGELGRVVDAAKASNATPEQTEDAILASMFSDSLKTKANFTTHHLDGELAADHILGKRLGGDFTQERLDGILHAIKEHQIAPPKFMAMVYGGIIRKMTGRPLSEEEEKSLSSLQYKMGDPLHQPTQTAADGGKSIILTEGEKTLLSRTGVNEWHVPSESSKWYKTSRILADADGIDNYATAGGLSKIIQIRGPETGLFFKDGNLRYEAPGRTAGKPVNSSQESWRDSFKDFATIASPDNLIVAESSARDAEQSAIKAQSRVDAWLHKRLNIPGDQALPTIPGWTGTAQLNAEGHAILNENGTLAIKPDNVKYPDYEPGWWAIHNKPVGARTAAEQEFYEDPANRYRGLSAKEIEDFKLAKEIRDKYAAELRKEQRTAGDDAPVYKPVVTH